MAYEAPALRERAFLQRLRNGLVLCNVVLVAVLIGLLVQWQASVLHNLREDELGRLQRLAHSISQTIAGEMNLVDLGLKNVTQQLQTMGTNTTPLRADQVNAMLAVQISFMPFLDDLMVTDAQGLVRFGNHLDPSQAIDLHESTYFQQARTQSQPAMLFSEALVSRTEQVQTLFAVRRRGNTDGSFAGIVSAAIEPAHFQHIFSALANSVEVAITLRNDQRQTLARVVNGQSQDQWFGNTETSPELARAFGSDAASGSFLSTARQDGIERLTAFQRVGGYPFIVIVGERTDSFLLPWQSQVERIALLCILVVAIVAALSVLVFFSIKRETSGRSKLESALQESWARMDASQDGVHLLDYSGFIVSASQSLSTLLGYHPDYLQGQPLSLLTALPLQDLLPHDAPRAVRKLQTQYRKLDGSLLNVELYVSMVLFSTGALLYCSARDISHFINNHQEKS
jgi:PAS domain S-box-containing protein